MTMKQRFLIFLSTFYPVAQQLTSTTWLINFTENDPEEPKLTPYELKVFLDKQRKLCHANITENDLAWEEDGNIIGGGRWYIVTKLYTMDNITLITQERKCDY